MSDTDSSVTLGRITIEYFIDGDSDEPTISFEFADTDQLSLPTQLGLLEMAKDTLLHPEDDDE